MAKPKRADPEGQLQRACCQILQLYENCGRLLYFAVPNAARRSPALAAKLKREGLRAGVPDLVVLTFGRATFLELKAGKNDLQKSQEDWRDKLTDKGFGWALIRSVDDLNETLMKLGLGRAV